MIFEPDAITSCRSWKTIMKSWIAVASAEHVRSGRAQKELGLSISFRTARNQRA